MKALYCVDYFKNSILGLVEVYLYCEDAVINMNKQLNLGEFDYANLTQVVPETGILGYFIGRYEAIGDPYEEGVRTGEIMAEIHNKKAQE